MKPSTPRIDVVSLCSELIARPSVTPDDQGCQDLIADLLTPLGFVRQNFNQQGVCNSWLRLGDRSPLLVLAGHTDVVPPGDRQQWLHDPFTPTVKQGFLYGRGASDMKASLAAMVGALAANASDWRSEYGSIALLLTSDEEGPAQHGTRYALSCLAEQKVVIDHCLIGEPTCRASFGDTIKIGRRGSLNAHLVVRGKQGHIAYPHLAINPIHLILNKLRCLIEPPLDSGTEQFEASSLQISSLQAGVAGNVIPGQVAIRFNIRYSPVFTEQSLRADIERRLAETKLDFQLTWVDNPSEPFLSHSTHLAQQIGQVVKQQTGLMPEFNTAGGTSDGRFIFHCCDDLAEFGPPNATIHQINERVAIEDITALEQVYTAVIRQMSRR